MKNSLFSSNRHILDIKNFLPKQDIEYLCKDCVRFRVFDPASTLYCFLFQVLDGCSAKSALAFFCIQRRRLGLSKISTNSAAYIKAKKRLCEHKLKKLVCLTGRRLNDEASFWKFKDRDVYLGDGTILNLEDTKEIKKDYPLTYSSGRSQGQPKMRLFGFFCASSGAFIDGEIGAYCGKGQGEPSLFRNMIRRLKKESIIVLDRFFTSYQLQALMREENIDYVIRARDKSAKKILGRKSDLVETIKNSKRRDKNFYSYDRAPDFMKVRYIKSSIKRAGFRTAHIYILTNLFVENGFSREDVERLYLRRWDVEVDIRHLKVTLEGSMLRSKSACQARKELWVHLLAFNLVRTISNLSAHKRKKEGPHKHSFKFAMKAYLYRLICSDLKDTIGLIEDIENEILKSKYRREPRAIKRRTIRYPLLTTTRENAKKEKWGYSRRRGRVELQAGQAS